MVSNGLLEYGSVHVNTLIYIARRGKVQDMKCLNFELFNRMKDLGLELSDAAQFYIISKILACNNTECYLKKAAASLDLLAWIDMSSGS